MPGILQHCCTFDMHFDFQNLRSVIADSPIITVFRHEHPDCDAMGSQSALVTWLKENFPDKKVYALGYETCDQAPFPASDRVNDDTIAKSTAIVLDTANQDRVDDKRFKDARFLIKIDHHPNREPFGNLCLVFDQAAATCEILTAFFEQNSDLLISGKTARYLYEGLLTDTLCFRTSNTTAHTLHTASFLASFQLDIPSLNRMLFDTDLEGFRFATYLRSRVQLIDGHLAYVILRRKDLQEWHLSASSARNRIDELGHVKEFAVWVMFTQHDDGQELFDGSLRSKNVTINDIAEKYHGGGHKNASGVKNLSEADINQILQDLDARIQEEHH